MPTYFSEPMPKKRKANVLSDERRQSENSALQEKIDDFMDADKVGKRFDLLGIESEASFPSDFNVKNFSDKIVY